PIEVRLDGEPLAQWQSHVVKAGALLQFGRIKRHGCRVYLAVQGGFQIPAYLGSKATFTLGLFGGHAGRALRNGDILHTTAAQNHIPHTMPKELTPHYTDHWEIGVLYGPHGAPDFFTETDFQQFF